VGAGTSGSDIGPVQFDPFAARTLTKIGPGTLTFTDPNDVMVSVSTDGGVTWVTFDTSGKAFPSLIQTSSSTGKNNLTINSASPTQIGDVDIFSKFNTFAGPNATVVNGIVSMDNHVKKVQLAGMDGGSLFIDNQLDTLMAGILVDSTISGNTLGQLTLTPIGNASTPNWSGNDFGVDHLTGATLGFVDNSVSSNLRVFNSFAGRIIFASASGSHTFTGGTLTDGSFTLTAPQSSSP
jgi:hypothetical protein